MREVDRGFKPAVWSWNSTTSRSGDRDAENARVAEDLRDQQELVNELQVGAAQRLAQVRWSTWVLKGRLLDEKTSC